MFAIGSVEAVAAVEAPMAKRFRFKTADSILPGGEALPTNSAAPVPATSLAPANGAGNPPSAPPAASTTAPVATTAPNPIIPSLDGLQAIHGAPDRNGLPRAWVEGLAQLQAMSRLDDIPPHCWHAIQTTAVTLESKGWAVKAASSGWTTEQVFGIHRSAPLNRFDFMGLLLALADGSDLTGITPDVAHFSGGQRMRCEFVFTHEQCLLWELNTQTDMEN
ncbi:MAG: hypothetical protein HQL90_10670 [Magnetococcales bacterium]|nr:hypothetical protein [Magnetococcales bacterium]